MIMNSTQFSYFRLAAYFDVGWLRYFYFFLLFFLYACIICLNLLLIVVICMNRTLHEPMYIFLCSLLVNELYGSTGLFPMILVQILSDVHTVSKVFCFMQIFCLYCYITLEYVSLAIMSYDRYLAICQPLQYNAKMTSRTAALLIAAAWLYGVFAVGVMLSLSASLQLCDNVINKMYCDNYPVVKLSCSDTSAINIFSLFSVVRVVLFPLLLIVYTYIKILRVCFCGSKETRQKALRTCTPHLASILNFTIGGCFEVLQSRFNMNNVPNILRIFLSLYVITSQPFFCPLIYGLKLAKIRLLCKNMISRKSLG